MRTLLAAPDKFRDTASAADVALAIERGARASGWRAQRAPLSDGGEGFLAVYGQAIGAIERRARVTGPLGAPVEALWAMAGTTAVVEMATASGLELAGGASGNDPLGATTRGTGELIARAVSSGARTVVVGCGGSATTDGGEGAVEALRPHSRLARVSIVVACDVRTRFPDAAEVFAAQKGASAREVALLTRRLRALAEQYRGEFGVDVTTLEGGGAAGGLAGGLAALGARLENGCGVVAEVLALRESIAAADLVVTGEGLVDRESFDGKVVGSVAAMAAETGTAVMAIAGTCVTEAPIPVLSLTDLYGREASMGETLGCVEKAVAQYLDRI